MTGDNGEMIAEMINLFLTQLSETRLEFKSLCDNKNWLELSRLAHKIKSSAMVMGVGALVDEMKELEYLAKDAKDTEKYPEYIARFDAMIDSIEIELKPFLNSMNC